MPVFEIHVHIKPEPEVLRQFGVVIRKLDLMMQRQEFIMATMAELQAAVTRNTDVDESVLTLLAGISQQLKDAQASGDPAAIAEVIAKLDANTQKMADAVAANTPAAPTP